MSTDGLTMAVLTEQHVPAGMEDIILQQELKGPGVSIDVLSLDAISSDQDVDSRLHALFGQLDPSVLQAHLVIICNASGTSAATERNVMFRCRECRLTFTNTVGKASAQKRNLIVVLCRTSTAAEIRNSKQSEFRMYFDASWHFVFADTICPQSRRDLPEEGLLRLEDYVTRPLLSEDHEDAMPACSDEVPILSVEPGKGKLSIRHLLEVHVADVVKSLVFPEDVAGSYYGKLAERIDKFRSLLASDEPGVVTMLYRVHRELASSPDLNGKIWLAAHMRRYDVALSVKENLQGFIANAVIATFKELVGLVGGHGNLRLAVAPESSKLWAELFGSALVSGSPGCLGLRGQILGVQPEAALVRVGGALACAGAAEAGVVATPPSGSDPHPQPVLRCRSMIHDLVFPASFRVRFPFSSTLAQALFSHREQQDHLEEIIESLSPALLALDDDQMKSFAQDVLEAVFLAGKPESNLELQLLLALLKVLSGGLVSVAELLRRVWSDEMIFVQVRALAGFGVQEGGWLQEESLDRLQLLASCREGCRLRDDDHEMIDDDGDQQRHETDPGEPGLTGTSESVPGPVGGRSNADPRGSRETGQVKQALLAKRRRLDDPKSEASVQKKRTLATSPKDSDKTRRRCAAQEIASERDGRQQRAAEFLIQILELVVVQQFHLISQEREMITAYLPMIQQLLGMVDQLLQPSLSQPDLEASAQLVHTSGFDAGGLGAIATIRSRLQLLNYCALLTSRTEAMQVDSTTRCCIFEHMRQAIHAASASDHVWQPCAGFQGFVELLEVVATMEDLSPEDAEVVSSCVAPVALLLLPLRPSETDARVLVPIVLRLLLGRVTQVRAAWRGSSWTEGAAGLSISYPAASTLLNWMLQLLEPGPHAAVPQQSAEVEAALTRQLLEEPEVENSQLAELV
ncbi:unnamed protein product, partial [Polarella glacialis]